MIFNNWCKGIFFLQIQFKNYQQYYVFSSYNRSLEICKLAVLDFLEEPVAQAISKEIFVALSVLPELPMICRGGEHCCHRGHGSLCGDGEGDCNTDNDCDGALVCGNNNCLLKRVANGLYDDQDDCCERACTPEHPCKHGGGTCSTDDDCLGEGSFCGVGNCMDEQIFPREKFPNNYFVDHFNSTDRCCIKLCSVDAPCGEDMYGCDSDAECDTGLYCDKSDRNCRDIDECDVNNGRHAGFYDCGRNSNCSKDGTGYICHCNPGFSNWTKYEGCSDINQCNSMDCGSQGLCVNTPTGNDVCVCKEGYTGIHPDCYDVDECKLGTDTCNTPTRIDTETSFISGEIKLFNIEPFTVGDGEHHTFHFDLQSYDTSIIGIGNIEEEIQFRIGIDSIIIGYKEGSSVTSIHSISNLPQAARIGKDFVSYQLGCKLLSGNIIINVGALGNNIKEDIAYSKYPSNFTTLSFQSFKDFAFWRNVHKDGPVPVQYCVNSIGSFLCTNVDNYGIGFGGIGSAGTTSTDFSIITSSLFSCASHIIPKLDHSVMGHGMATMDNYLFVCGGQINGVVQQPSNKCFKYNLNNPAEGWTASTDLPYPVGLHSMIHYESSIYVLGGIGGNDCHDDVLKFSQVGGQWVAMAKMLYNAHGVGAIADEEGGRIWTFGGYTHFGSKRKLVTYYDVSTNIWSYHSDLPYASEYTACAIIKDVNNYRKIICVLTQTKYSIHTYELDYSVMGWTSRGGMINMYNSFSYVTALKTLSFNEYSVAVVSGSTARFGRSLSNFYSLDLQNYKFNFNERFLQNYGFKSAWTSVPRSKKYKATTNCLASKTYAAIGWGGQSAVTATTKALNTQWSVILRQRTSGSNVGKPETCHGSIGIPDLVPGRIAPGITVVNYRLIVCGGKEKHEYTSNKCFFLDTNDVNVTKNEEVNTNKWSVMESMIKTRLAFPFETYGDVAYAIGGNDVSGNRADVEKWTLNNGWKETTPLPFPLMHACSTPYEGQGQIFIAGGRTQGTYNSKLMTLNVHTDTWSEHSNIGIGAAGDFCGMSIVQRKVDGHKLLYVVGGNGGGMYNFFYDLTMAEFNGTAGWKTVGVTFLSTYSKLIPLSLSEMIQVAILLFRKI